MYLYVIKIEDKKLENISVLMFNHKCIEKKQFVFYHILYIFEIFKVNNTKNPFQISL
jgi:hypothetical protein